jgi:hypothetical protein
MANPVKTPVLVRNGRRFIDEETVLQLLSDADPVLTLTLDRYIKQWPWEMVVPVKGAEDEGADSPGSVRDCTCAVCRSARGCICAACQGKN